MGSESTPLNIFVTNQCPYESAKPLPDRHVTKMSLEACQMVSVIYSHWYRDCGQVFKADGSPYKTTGGFRNHPCTVWASLCDENLAWLIAHGHALCAEYTHRYGKHHACEQSLIGAEEVFIRTTGKPISCYTGACGFARAMPDEFKLDQSISTFEAYKMYISSKPWVSANYLRKPERKPSWV